MPRPGTLCPPLAGQHPAGPRRGRTHSAPPPRPPRTPTPRHPDEDEFLDVPTMPFDELFTQVMDGTVTDAKTVATVLKTKYLLGL